MRIFFYSHIHALTKYLLNFHDVSSTVLYAEEEKKKRVRNQDSLPQEDWGSMKKNKKKVFFIQFILSCYLKMIFKKILSTQIFFLPFQKKKNAAL